MAVEAQSFEQVWPALSGRLSRVLQHRRVPAECVDDVVQETGLRLLRNWKKVDHDTLWSLTITIAGNIIKDDMRRRGRDELYAETLTSNSYVDIEERAIARVELWKTHRAIDALNAAQRTALLSEVYGFENTTKLSRGAVKMSRMRARRRLRETLGRASGLVALTGHRLRRLFDPRTGLSEGASQTVAAALLIAAGLDLVMLGGGVFRSAVPSETGRISGSASFGRTAGQMGDAGGLVAASGDHSFLSPGWVARGQSSQPGEDVIRHRESVGTGGASGWVQGTVLGQRATVDVVAQRSANECQGGTGGREENPVCVDRVAVKAMVHHNGKSYGATLTSDGRVSVEHPWNESGTNDGDN